MTSDLGYISEYQQYIVDNQEIVSNYIKLWYLKILPNKLKSGKVFYNDKKAKRAVSFIERWCHHHEGKLAPNRITLELWEKAFVSCIFGIVDKNGVRVYREILLVIARKNGKTLLAAAISAYMFFADHEHGARIYYTAPKLEQATIAFTAFRNMIDEEPVLKRKVLKRRQDIYCAETKSTAQPLAFSQQKSDGLNISCVTADELASWQPSAGLKFYEVLKSSMGARVSPMILGITTAGYVNDGIYDELIKRCTAVLNGTSDEERLLPILYIIDYPDKWDTVVEWHKSNPNLGVSVSVDYLQEECKIAKYSNSKKAEFLTKYCNIKANNSLAWLTYEDVHNAMKRPITMEDFRGRYAVAGVDLSHTTDLTAAVILVEENDEINVLAKFWLPKNRIEQAIIDDGIPYDTFVEKGWLELSGENAIDYHDVLNWFETAVNQYELLPLIIGYDRFGATYLVTDLEDFGFKTDSVRQGTNLTPVIREAENLFSDNKINIGDNSLLAACLMNAAKDNKTINGQSLCMISKIQERKRIDGTVALLDALTVRQANYADIGVQLTNNSD